MPPKSIVISSDTQRLRATLRWSTFNCQDTILLGCDPNGARYSPAQTTDSLITLTWTDLNTGANQATGFAVYRSTSPIDLQALPAPLAVLGPNTTSYVDGAAQPLATYYYRVSALRGTDEAVLIDEASAQIVPTVLGPRAHCDHSGSPMRSRILFCRGLRAALSCQKRFKPL